MTFVSAPYPRAPDLPADFATLREGKRVFDRLIHLSDERWPERLRRLGLHPDVEAYVVRLFAARARRDGVLDRPLPVRVRIVP